MFCKLQLVFRQMVPLQWKDEPLRPKKMASRLRGMLIEYHPGKPINNIGTTRALYHVKLPVILKPQDVRSQNHIYHQQYLYSRLDA